MATPLESLGKLLIRYRKLRGLKQYEVAQRVKTTADTISEYEAGTRSPGFQMLAKLIVALEIPGEDLEEAYAAVVLAQMDAEDAVAAARPRGKSLLRIGRSAEQKITYYERIRRAKGIVPKR